MGTPAPGGTPPFDEKRATFAFQEYQMVADDTSKITDRRQTVNTLFVTINALFLTGVGYLLYLYFQAREGDLRIFFFSLGFLAIAVITTLLNRAWLRLSEQSRRLIDLRIRYLERLEGYMRVSGYFPSFETPLKGMNPTSDKEYEAPPKTLADTTTSHEDEAHVMRRWMNTRGVYTLEEVLYNNPNPKYKVFGFSRAEQRVGATFKWAYWIAFAVSVIAIVVQTIIYYTGISITIGPFKF